MAPKKYEACTYISLNHMLSMLSNTFAFQITLSSYFYFLMTLPLATLTSLLLTPSWCWVLGKKVGHLATSRTCAFLLWLSSFFLYLLSEDLSARGGPPRTKRTFTTRQHTCSCSALFYISLPQTCSWLGTIQSCSLTELSRIQDGAFGISSCPPH